MLFMFGFHILDFSVCNKFPEFTKYFSKQMRPPLNIDSHMVAKYTLILESIGYLLLDCYDKPKQINRITGYTAMVHKDMRVNLQDFFVSLEIFSFTEIFG